MNQEYEICLQKLKLLHNGPYTFQVKDIQNLVREMRIVLEKGFVLYDISLDLLSDGNFIVARYKKPKSNSLNENIISSKLDSCI